MTARTALLLTNDPLEAYAIKYGAVQDDSTLNPGGVFERVIVAYQYEEGGRSHLRPGLDVCRIRKVSIEQPAPLRALAFLVSLVWFVIQVVRIARMERIDVIRAYNPFVQGAAAVIAGRLLRRPCVVSVHTDPSEILARLDRGAGGVLARLERFTLARADRLWCTTEYLRGVVVGRGATAERVRVLPNRVVLDDYSPTDRSSLNEIRSRYGIPEDAPVVLSVGRLHPEKDPVTLVRGFARIPQEEARLVLVGDGELREAVSVEADRAGLDGRVVVTGFRPREEIPSLLYVADCFVMASQYEGFPFALLEAMAAGVPVVVSEIPQIDELLEGTGALRFPVGDDRALSERISEVLADPAPARARAASARELMTKFDRAEIDLLEASLYEDLFTGRPAEVIA